MDQPSAFTVPCLTDRLDTASPSKTAQAATLPRPPPKKDVPTCSYGDVVVTMRSSPWTLIDRVVIAVWLPPSLACFSMSAICWRCCDGGVISAPRMMSRISLCCVFNRAVGRKGRLVRWSRLSESCVPSPPPPAAKPTDRPTGTPPHAPASAPPR